MTTHGFDLGSLDLASGFPHDDGYTLSVLGAGATFGQSQAVVRQIVSMLADGDLVSYDRAGNRVAEFDVLIEGADGTSLQAGEVALRRELYRPNTVTWTPPADFSAPTVFEVVTSEMAPKFDDLDELRTRRVFHVTLTCAPFARSAVPVTVQALTVGVTPTIVTINNADTTSGWTALGVVGSNPSFSNPVTDEGSFVRTTLTGEYAGVSLILTTSQDVTATRYIEVEVSGSPALGPAVTEGTPGFGFTFDGGVTPYLLPVLTRLLSGGRTLYVFDANGYSTLTRLAVSRRYLASPVTSTVEVHDVRRTDTLSVITKRQTARIVSVLGTERTPASLAIASADGTTNLGMTVVHTSPEDGSGYSPPLRRWRVSGAASPTADTSTMSGAREPIAVANPFIAEVPNEAIPEGGYLLAARLRVSSPGMAIINWATETVIDGVGDGYVTDYATVTFPNTGWFFVPVAVLTLPSVRSYSGKVRVLLSSATAELDEGWLFRVDDGCALTVVHNVVKPRLWLDSPDVSSRVPRIWIGNDAGRADASHPGANLYCHGNHTFTPDATATFVATSGAENPKAALTYYPRWPSNAAS